jgi:hypothetical protein
MAEKPRFRRGAETVSEYRERAATAEAGATEAHKKRRRELQEEAYRLYEQKTGKKVERGIAGAASRKAYQEWARSPAGQAAWKGRKKKPTPTPTPTPTPKPKVKPAGPGITAQDAGDALASETEKKKRE